MRVETGTIPGVTAEEADRVRHSSASGGRSETVAEGDGIDVSFDGRPGDVVGEKGEDEVFALVTGFFLTNAEGIPVKPCPYSERPEDQRRPDDRSFRYGDERILVQIVSAQPSGSWGAAAKGTAHAQGDLAAFGDWLDEAVLKKSGKYL